MKGLIMAHQTRIDCTFFCLLKWRLFLITAVIASAALNAGHSAAQPPAVTLTKIGSPIWRPVDFQLFSAPVEPDGTATAISRALEPLQPPSGVAPYTTPHGPPYDSELSTNMAAAGFVSRSVFPREAIMGDPNRIHIAFMLLPDPGITGSARDFASGPVIPDSLYPLSGHSEMWKDGALEFNFGDSQIVLRPTELPFEGTSHRIILGNYWNRGANNLGDFERRSSLRDAQGNGWDFVAPFKVVAALPPGDFNQDGTVDAADYIVWRKSDGTQTGYDTWRANFGTSLSAGSGSAIPSAGPLPAVPEPATRMIASIAAIVIGVALRRPARKQGRPVCIA
jgi:hypothetical protein